jgi:NADH dehydrogenase
LRPEQLKVAIIGAGATGVELAAQLHRTTREMVAYGLDRVDLRQGHQDQRHRGRRARAACVAAAPVAGHTEPACEAGRAGPHRRRVAEVLRDRVLLADGRTLPAELVVWAAGVKAPDILKDLGGLETNRSTSSSCGRRFRPHATTTCSRWATAPLALGPVTARYRRGRRLRTSRRHTCTSRFDGGCRAAAEELRLPRLRLAGVAREFSTVGNMMGGLIGGSLLIEGAFARLMYLSLYKMHELALHGPAKVTLDTLARLITRRTEPHVKLH